MNAFSEYLDTAHCLPSCQKWALAHDETLRKDYFCGLKWQHRHFSHPNEQTPGIPWTGWDTIWKQAVQTLSREEVSKYPSSSAVPMSAQEMCEQGCLLMGGGDRSWLAPSHARAQSPAPWDVCHACCMWHTHISSARVSTLLMSGFLQRTVTFTNQSVSSVNSCSSNQVSTNKPSLQNIYCKSLKMHHQLLVHSEGG